MGPDAAVDRLQVHGTLVEVLGVGVLLLGPSGVGKSETALELVVRDHRLVADDVVELERSGDRIVGRAPELIRHHLEIRGLGILYLPDLYGPEAVGDEAAVGLVCRLEQWREGEGYERLGLERPEGEWLGLTRPELVLAVRPSANMATLVEVAVRDHKGRSKERPAAARLDERLGERMRNGERP